MVWDPAAEAPADPCAMKRPHRRKRDRKIRPKQRHAGIGGHRTHALMQEAQVEACVKEHPELDGKEPRRAEWHERAACSLWRRQDPRAAAEQQEDAKARVEVIAPALALQDGHCEETQTSR